MASSDPKQLELFAMAATILADFESKLTWAFSCNTLGTWSIEAIADQFLANGLIAEDAYRSILDSALNGSKNAKSNILFGGIQWSVANDESCFETVLHTLNKVLGSQNKLVLDIKGKYDQLKCRIPQPKRRKLEESSPVVQATNSHKLGEHFADAQIPEIKVIQKFTVEIVKALSTYSILKVSDEFLREGLITEGVYSRMLVRSTSDDNKARILLNAVKDTIRTDDKCFKTVLEILKALPFERVMSDIDTEYRKFASQSNPQEESLAGSYRRARNLTTVRKEISVVQKFTPELVNALSSCVMEVLDQCLRNGIVSDSMYKLITEINQSTGSEYTVRLLYCKL